MISLGSDFIASVYINPILLLPSSLFFLYFFSFHCFLYLFPFFRRSLPSIAWLLYILMTSFLRSISCGIIDLGKHPQHRKALAYSLALEQPAYSPPPIDAIEPTPATEGATTEPAATTPNHKRRRSSITVTRQQLVSRLSMLSRRKSSKGSYSIEEDPDMMTVNTRGGFGDSDNDALQSSNMVLHNTIAGVIGESGRDFLIRDEDVQVSSYEGSFTSENYGASNNNITTTMTGNTQRTRMTGAAAATGASSGSVSPTNSPRLNATINNVTMVTDRDRTSSTGAGRRDSNYAVGGAIAGILRTTSYNANNSSTASLDSIVTLSKIQGSTTSSVHMKAIHHHESLRSGGPIVVPKRVVLVDTSLDRNFGF